MAATSTFPILHSPFPSILNPKPPFFITTSPPFSSPLASSTRSSKSANVFRKKRRVGEICAISGESETGPVGIVSGNQDASTVVIQVLLFLAFIGLSVLTVGVIYLGVTDFLRKREAEKIEKEEAAKKKKKGGKKDNRVRARAGPRGFGQKIDPDDEDD